MSRLASLSPRIIGVDPGPGLTKIDRAGVVFKWPDANGEEVAIRFMTTLDGDPVPANRHGADRRVARIGNNLNTLSFGNSITTRLGRVLSVLSGEVTEA